MKELNLKLSVSELCTIGRALDVYKGSGSFWLTSRESRVVEQVLEKASSLLGELVVDRKRDK